MAERSARPTPRPTVAPATDQVDALVGMLLEASELITGLLGGSFDYDRVRDGLYATAAAPVGTNTRADRYRARARRGIHTSHAQVGTDVPPCERAD